MIGNVRASNLNREHGESYGACARGHSQIWHAVGSINAPSKISRRMLIVSLNFFFFHHSQRPAVWRCCQLSKVAAHGAYRPQVVALRGGSHLLPGTVVTGRNNKSTTAEDSQPVLNAYLHSAFGLPWQCRRLRRLQIGTRALAAGNRFRSTEQNTLLSHNCLKKAVEISTPVTSSWRSLRWASTTLIATRSVYSDS